MRVLATYDVGLLPVLSAIVLVVPLLQLDELATLVLVLESGHVVVDPENPLVLLAILLLAAPAPLPALLRHAVSLVTASVLVQVLETLLEHVELLLAVLLLLLYEDFLVLVLVLLVVKVSSPAVAKSRRGARLHSAAAADLNHSRLGHHFVVVGAAAESSSHLQGHMDSAGLDRCHVASCHRGYAVRPCLALRLWRKGERTVVGALL